MMKSTPMHARRLVAFVITLVMLMSMIVTTSAAESKSYNLYSFVAEKAYSGRTTEVKMLTSGALVNKGSVVISYPYNGLLSVTSDKLTAASFASGVNGKSWTPVSYVVNGKSGSFNGTGSATITKADSFDVKVTYQLDTGISSDILDLPSVLASEAASQMTVLNRLVDEDEPYMGYMEQMTKSQLEMFASVLGIFTLNADAKKDAALKNSFRDVIKGMQSNCFLDDGTLTFYDLLWGYIFGGLAFYYECSEDFLREISLFSQYLDRILGAETRDGVYLTSRDKEAAIQKMVKTAEQFGYIEAGVGFDFVDMRNKTNTAKSMLTAPNAAINTTSSKLSTLTTILEKEATEIRGNSSASVIPAYGKALVLTAEVSAVLTPGESGSEDAPTGGTTPPSGDDDTPGGGGYTPPSGGGTTTPPSGGDPNPGAVSSGGTVHIGVEDNLRRSFADAKEGDVIFLDIGRTMVEDIHVHKNVTFLGAKNLKENGFLFLLRNTSASLTSDVPLSVASLVDGYVPVKSSAAESYKLAEIKHPEIGGKTAGSKTELVNDTRYLFLDLDPSKGSTLNELRDSASFAEFSGYTVSFAIEGNDGTGLVKTDDRLVVTAKNADGKTIATISYVVVVMGDTNCNGKVNTSDATVSKNISMGAACSAAVKMAADVNLSGTAGDPKVNSSDVAYSMAKWFNWDLNKYVSNMK